MKIIRTGHHINEAVSQMLKQGNPDWEFVTPKQIVENPEPCIGYGILRGCAEAFKACEAANVEWWQIDRAYAPFLRETHLRFSYRGTQAAFIPDMDSVRRERQEWPEVTQARGQRDGYCLLLPPTSHVVDFYRVHDWVARQERRCAANDIAMKIRRKNGAEPDSIEKDLAGAAYIIGFNSSLMVEAMLAGNAVFGAPQSMIGDWNKSTSNGFNSLFNCMAHFQFDHEEISNGMAWRHLQWVREKHGLQSLYRLGC